MLLRKPIKVECLIVFNNYKLVFLFIIRVMEREKACLILFISKSPLYNKKTFHKIIMRIQFFHKIIGNYYKYITSNIYHINK